MVSMLRYIRQCIAKADTPHLMLMSKERVYSSLPHNDFHMPGMRNPSWKFSHPSAIFFSLHEEGCHQSKLVLQLHRSSLEDQPHFQVVPSTQNFICDILTSGYIFCGLAMSTLRMSISSTLGSIHLMVTTVSRDVIYRPLYIYTIHIYYIYLQYIKRMKH